MSRTCVWDGESLVLPSDSGSLIWWSVSGIQLFETQAGPADFTVCLQWSVSGGGLWRCGFSTLSYLDVVRDDTGARSGRHRQRRIGKCWVELH